MANWHIKNMDVSKIHYCGERNIPEKELLEPMSPFLTYLIDRKASILCRRCLDKYIIHIHHIYNNGTTIQ